ncbi:MAG: cytochrome c3 family protein [Raoultibacter sp.]
MTNAHTSTDKRLVVLALVALVLALAAVLFFAVGCAPKEASAPADGAQKTEKADPLAGQPANWTMKSDCASCHTTESATMTDTSCPQGALHKEQTCISCHTEEPILQTAHADVKLGDKAASKATVASVDPQTCITCHGTMEEMAAKTLDSKALTDDKGLTVNPHARPAGERHAETPAVCTDCHSAHSKTLEKDAMKYCAQCHHRGVFECGTCHELRERTTK